MADTLQGPYQMALINSYQDLSLYSEPHKPTVLGLDNFLLYLAPNAGPFIFVLYFLYRETLLWSSTVFQHKNQGPLVLFSVLVPSKQDFMWCEYPTTTEQR